MMDVAIVVTSVVAISELASVMWHVTRRRHTFGSHLIGACAVWLMVFGTVMVTA